MNAKLNLEMQNQTIASSADITADEATLRALALAMIRQDSRENPSAYLSETEAPYGGE